MKKEELFDYIDGLMAYDHGALDSGIKDDDKKNEIKRFLNEDFNRTTILLTEFVRDRILKNPEATLEDIQEFLTWISNEFNIDY